MLKSRGYLGIGWCLSAGCVRIPGWMADVDELKHDGPSPEAWVNADDQPRCEIDCPEKKNRERKPTTIYSQSMCRASDLAQLPVL